MNRALFVLACSILLPACSGPVAGNLPEGEPYVRGPIESIDHRATASGILVAAGPGSREACGISATADSDTRYFRRTAAGQITPAAVGDLVIGDTVEVYVEGPVAESCPVQGYAAAIVILGG